MYGVQKGWSLIWLVVFLWVFGWLWECLLHQLLRKAISAEDHFQVGHFFWSG